MYEFKRDIAQQALNPRTGKIIAERVVRYYEDKIKQKDAVIEKLRLKNVTLKAYKNKLGLQLKQKEEMGEVLHAIDFDQLQIENKQYLLKIEERNAELLKLKMTASRTVQILNEFKKSLSLKTLESESIAADIMQRKDLLRKLQQEEVNVGRDLQHADKQNAWLKCQIQEYKVPDVSLIKIGDAVCNGQGFPL
jgi:NifB/MoaA-like Fe-S oxidoreductase